MKLVHWTEKPFDPKKVNSVPQTNIHEFKPDGLWVSDEDQRESWLWWCTGERFALDSFNFGTEVRLAPDAKVLHIKNTRMLDDFHRVYSRSFGEIRPGLSELTTRWIDWKKFAEDHQGILITPYQWNRRFHRGMLWYYGWDCASGCIWDMSAIKEFIPITIPEIEAMKKRVAREDEEVS